jgi:hypothetical protein
MEAARDDEEWEKHEGQKAEAIAKEAEEKAERKEVVSVHVAVPAEIPSENFSEEGGLKEPLLRKIELPSRHGRLV